MKNTIWLTLATGYSKYMYIFHVTGTEIHCKPTFIRVQKFSRNTNRREYFLPSNQL